MKKLALLFSLVAVAPVFAAPAAPPSTPVAAPQSELPYDELMHKGEIFLIPDDKKLIYEGAAIAFFHRAAKVALDDGKRLEALLRAGQTNELLKQFPSTIKAYEEALALKNISAAQKTRANFALANAKFQLANKDSALYSRSKELHAAFSELASSPDLPAEMRTKTHTALAEIQASNSKYLEAAQEYQKVLSLPNLAPESRVKFLARAVEMLGKAPAQENVLTLANALYAEYLPLLKPAAAADARQSWASILEKAGDIPGAVAKWSEIAGDESLPAGRRSIAWRVVSNFQRNARKYPEALAAADRMTEIELLPHIQFSRSEARAAVFEAQKFEANVRAEWQALLAIPQVTPDARATAHQRIALSFKRERAAAPQNSDAAQFLDGEKKALEAVWQTDGAKIDTRQTALLDRAQIEADAGNLDAASTLLLDAVKTAETFAAHEQAVAHLKRSLYLALSLVHRAQKNNPKAIAALIAAQGFSTWGDNTTGQNALSLMQEVFAAKDWDSSRAVLLSFKTVWGVPEKTYLFNLAQVEIGAQNWPAAKKALDDFDALNPSIEERSEANKLRAQIPATP